MSEFTYLFRGRNVPASAEERQQHLEKWLAWFKDLGAKGHLKDPPSSAHRSSPARLQLRQTASYRCPLLPVWFTSLPGYALSLSKMCFTVKNKNELLFLWSAN